MMNWGVWKHFYWSVVYSLTDVANICLSTELSTNGVGPVKLEHAELPADQSANATPTVPAGGGGAWGSAPTTSAVESVLVTEHQQARQTHDEVEAKTGGQLDEWLPSHALVAAVAQDDSHRRFLTDFVEQRADTAGAALAAHLFENITRKQALGRRGNEAVSHAERAVAAAMLYHEGHVAEAMTFGSYLLGRDSKAAAGGTPTRTRIPKKVEKTWRAAYNLRVW